MAQAAPQSTVGGYYLKLFRRALAEAFAAIGLTKPTEAFRSLVVWSFTVLALYNIGWSRIPIVGTENPDASSEVRLGLSAVSAIVLIFTATLVWRLIVLPPRFDAELKRELEEHRAEIDTDADVEIELMTLSKMRLEGLDLYEAIKDPTDDEQYHAWRTALDAWAQRVRSRLEAQWSVAAIHEFDDAGRSGGWTRMLNDQEVHDKLEAKSRGLMSRYTSRFAAVDHLVRSGHFLFIGEAVVKSARDDAGRLEVDDVDTFT